MDRVSEFAAGAWQTMQPVGQSAVATDGTWPDTIFLNAAAVETSCASKKRKRDSEEPVSARAAESSRRDGELYDALWVAPKPGGQAVTTADLRHIYGRKSDRTTPADENPRPSKFRRILTAPFTAISSLLLRLSSSAAAAAAQRPAARTSHAPSSHLSAAPRTPSPAAAADPFTPHVDETIRVAKNWQTLKPSQHAAIRAERLARVADLTSEGWSDADAALYRKLMMRGFDPVFPAGWAAHFPSLPRSLFTEAPSSVNAVDNDGTGKGDAHGVHHMHRLFDVGPKVRSNLDTGAAPEKWTYVEARRCQHWARKDAGVQCRLDQASIPANMILVRGESHHSQEALQAEIVRRFEQAEEEWMVRLRLSDKAAVPPLYGMICAGSSVIVVAWNARGGRSPSGEDERLRPIMTMDYRNKAYDAWNAMAMAIVICHARDELVRVVVGNVFEPIESDPVDGVFLQGAQVGGRYRPLDPDL